jgi:ArsR family metal-binding transcriptional regulator
MSNKNKLRVIKDLDKLSDEIIDQIKMVYPDGFSQHLIEFTNHKGELVSALPFETADTIYMIRMSKSVAIQIVDEDPDYDDSGSLKKQIKDKFKEEYSDVDYLADNENFSYEDYD